MSEVQDRKRKRKWQSPEARAILEDKENDPDALVFAEEAERAYRKVHLRCVGRIYNSEGRVNGPGNTINSAKLDSYDPQQKIVKIRIDDTRLPECWLEIELPVDQLLAFVQNEENLDVQSH